MWKLSIACLGFCAAVLGGMLIGATARGAATNEAVRADLSGFAQLEPIDTHAHVLKDDPEFGKFLQRYRLHLLDIVVPTKDDATFSDIESKISAAKAVVRDSGGHAVLCTTFDPFKFSHATFAADAMRELNQDFEQGAVAVKIWKNIGMELKDEAGRFVLPDDPRLDPIYADLATHGKTLIAHLAEPDSCWLPPNKNSPDYSYYNNHPEWYMFKQPDHPTKGAILQARDHMLEKHPQLRVVGAHLGSMETNLEELGRRFDRYPNFAVDVAARTVYLTIQPADQVRQFVLKYQDRLVYGTDLNFFTGQNVAAAETRWMQQYAEDWAFFSTNRTLTYRGRQVKGLGLPQQVLRKLYHDNAVNWIHGIVPAGSSPSANTARP